eukprot:1162022-Pelagomonas_calceolata.AAC.4
MALEVPCCAWGNGQASFGVALDSCASSSARTLSYIRSLHSAITISLEVPCCAWAEGQTSFWLALDSCASSSARTLSSLGACTVQSQWLLKCHVVPGVEWAD